MTFKIDFIDGKAISWRKTESGVRPRHHENYHPRFYIEGDRSKLHKSRVWLSQQDDVVATCFETWRPTLSKPEQKVLRVDVSSTEKLKQVAHRVKKGFGRSTFRFYNVDFSPQFRFCLQNEICPVPSQELERVKLRLHRKHLADENLEHLNVDGEKIAGTEEEVLDTLIQVWNKREPDIIQVSRGQVLQLIRKKAQEYGSNFSLGRIDKFQELAEGNKVTSYGKTQYAAARYNIPGRIVIDESNSFMLGEATLKGLWDLVERSYRPMQELAWGSIGRILTSIEVKKAFLEENTLTPWKNWSGEKPKKASTLHKADRGGFIFNPEPGVHRDVYEADFASLFPNIMVKENISPETVNCSCCSNSQVPELDFDICQKQRGFISEVLRPLVEDRQEMKEKVDDIEDEGRRKYVKGSIDAIKWILVSCFGYMGHAHASYGAIKCHQAIQAFDRNIMVKSKEMFESSGYSISHGIIDSIWVQKQDGARDFEEVCSIISDEVGIELEPEYEFDWVAFVPRSSSKADISTLNRYFGKRKNGEFKTAGIELEQSSTCQYVKDSQMEMIKALDKDLDPEDAIEVLEGRLEDLKKGNIDLDNLLIQKKVSKSLEAYQSANRNFHALKRYRKHNIDIKPGQKVRYVVRNDSVDSMDRVRLGFEDKHSYDTSFYTEQLIRSCESVLGPFNVSRSQIESLLNGKDCRLTQHKGQKQPGT